MAQLALCATLTTRRLAEGERLIRSGEPWQWGMFMMLGTDIRGRRLGVIGMGEIGEAVAVRARAFGMEIVYFNRGRVPEDTEARLGAQRVELDEGDIALPIQDETLLDVDQALDKLQAINPELARFAELRLFGGLSVREVAPVMGQSLTTAKENWALARAWLARLLRPAGTTGSPPTL